MLKESIVKKLFLYNIHIGHIGFFNTQLNYFLFGKRLGFSIININKAFFLLKKALFFLSNLSKKNGSLLYYITNFTNLSIIYKCVFFSISRKTNQQLILYNWVFSSINNFFISFFRFVTELTNIWMNDLNASIHSLNVHRYYLNYSLEDKINFFFFNLTNDISAKKKKRYYFKKWYDSWIEKQKSYDLYKKRKMIIEKSEFFTQLCFNDINNQFKKKTVFEYKYLFLKLFFYIDKKIKDTFFFDYYIKNTLKKNIDPAFELINKKILSYWRLILYYKYFSLIFQLPDALFFISPNNNDLPANEFVSNNLVTIGLVDTDSNVNNINYPIISNDDNLLIVVFYFSLFSNLFFINKLMVYRLLKKK